MAKNIVFVVGAGANHEYGFPTGAELIPLVRNYLSSRHGQVNNHEPEIASELRDAIGKLDSTTIPSIDLFMQLQSKQRNNGGEDWVSMFCRRGITQTILGKEKKYLGNGGKKPDWLEYIINQMVSEAGHDPNRLINSRIKFITFNYDRLIEFKIREVIFKLLGIAESKADELTNAFADASIVHVYGSIGKLSDVEFGATPEDGEVNTYSKNINIIGDRRNEKAGKRIKTILGNASQLHFLGFGFNDENIAQLGLDSGSDLRIVSGTCRGLMNAELSRIHFHFWKILTKRLILIKGTDSCLEYVKSVVEFSPNSGVAHFRSEQSGEVVCLPLNETCSMRTMRGNVQMGIDELIVGNWVNLKGNRGEKFEFLGKFDPFINNGTPIAKQETQY